MVMALNQQTGGYGSVRAGTDLSGQRPRITSALTGQPVQEKFIAGQPINMQTAGQPINMQTAGQPISAQIGLAPQNRPMATVGEPFPQTTTAAPTMQTAAPTMQTAAPTMQTAAPTMQTAAPQPQYGQQGAENAINEYLNAGLGLMNDAGGAALSQYGDAEQRAMSLLGGSTMAGRQDIADAIKGMQSQIDSGQAALSQGRSSADLATNKMLNKATGYLDPYNKTGQKTMDLQAAYTGALGPEAQKAAFDSYMSSPNLAWLKQQGEESIMNQATATGGVGGGDVLKELQKYGTGLASQDFDNQFNRLGSLTSQGMQAGAQMGQFANQAGSQMANNAMSAAQGQANLSGQAAGTIANLGAQKAGMAQQFGQNASNLAMGSAGQRADIIANLANSAFGQMTNAGNNVANMRYQTGGNLANQIGNVTGQMSGLTNQQGSTIADLLTNSSSGIGNLLTGTSTNSAQMQMQLAQLLANIATGQGTQLAGLQQTLGAHQGAAAAASGQGLRNTTSQVAGAMAMFSDRRLKDNITLMERKNGINFYGWKWNKLSGLVGHAFGVMADEVRNIIPDAVKTMPNGFDAVDYAKVAERVNGPI